MSRRTLAAAVVAGAVFVAGGGVAYAQVQGGSGSYRTATAAAGDVDRTIELSGTISASARRDLSFGVAGTIADVSVAAGDAVRSGADLASLDPTALEASVTRARAALAKALAQLESDQTSQSETVSAGVATTSQSSGSSTSKDSAPAEAASPATPSPALKEALAKLATQQQAVTEAKTASTSAISVAKAALVAQVAACEISTTEGSTDPAPSDDSADPDSADGTEADDAAGLPAECAAALDAVQSAQDVVADRQDDLQAALEDLSTTLTDAMAAVQESSKSTDKSTDSSSTPPASTSSSAKASSTSSDSSSAGGGGSGGAVVTAATLARDQASIDTAQAALTEAERSLEAATMTAPFAGRVLSVSVEKGDATGASDVVIVIVGNGDTTATTTVTTDQIPDVAKGQLALVTPAGATEPVEGTVTSIGLLPDSSSDTTTYPVTIDLSGTVAAPEGSTAGIALVTGTAEGVVTVPSSAVSTVRGTTVTVLTDGEPVRTTVTVGVIGSVRTEIASGLKAGQEIVLADLDAALPSGDGETTTLPGAGGGRGGQGGPGGGGGAGGGGRGR